MSVEERGSSHYRAVGQTNGRLSNKTDSRVLASGVVIRQHDIQVDDSPRIKINRAVAIQSTESQLSHTPSPRNLRERLQYPIERGSSGRSSGHDSRERRPALERIAEPNLCTHISPIPDSSLNSDRLLDVNIQYDGLENQQHFSPGFNIGSSQQSRIPATLELSDANEAGPSNFKGRTAQPPSSKTAGKRKVTKANPKTTVKRSSKATLPGVKLKTVMVSRALNPSRKRQCTDNNSIPCNKATTSDSSRHIYSLILTVSVLSYVK
ncbi:unnamed protein product [Eruca vesicaria subsp. sativa]|uniref:Uncharacterized protein n=1 Tax=Eruca vesicaria subsp. sativa TaxID=29727 RepID=A0ABC8JJI4_ERUVS|nr:unnamed protein product [Eruca vesicaria subsp. sativa]